MFKRIMFIPLFVIFSLISCKEDSISTKKIANLLQNLGIGDSAVSAVLYITGGKTCNPYFPDPDSNSLNVFAYITDDYQFVNPTNISADGIPLTNMDNFVGQLGGRLNYYPVYPNNHITWNINGWGGQNYTGNQEIPVKMSFININPLDTINTNTNNIIQYSGNENNDSIYIHIFPSPDNRIILNIDSIPGNNDIYLLVPDNGQVIINSSLFSNHPKNIYYDFNLVKTKTQIEAFNGFRICKKSLCSLCSIFFIK
ncbi:MAG: hypothetical protein NT007_01010 [Candidatus Kapabacteria bacterium]|nr:hypothetical protein [Candidatus Kapabacteria bacterium]